MTIEKKGIKYYDNILTYTSFAESCTERGSVRLTRENDFLEGLVEVCGYKGDVDLTWKTVCTTGWDDNEAQVICRQLGSNRTYIMI